MSEQNKTIDYEKAVEEVRKACYSFSDLYFHFSKVLVEEFGSEKAKELITTVVTNRAIERGLKLRENADKKNLPYTIDNFSKVTDIPFIGWDKSLGNKFCPYGEAWLSRYDKDPWFKDFALLYCDTNDRNVTETYTGNISEKIIKNVLSGDQSCERIYFDKK